MNKERIRLLITDDSLPMGGKETLLLQQLKHLDRDTFEVHLVTQTDKGELLPQAREMADHYFCLHRRCGLDLSAIHRLKRYMVDHSIDIVHTNGWIDSLYVWLAAGRLKVKKIATENTEVHRDKKDINSEFSVNSVAKKLRIKQ